MRRRDTHLPLHEEILLLALKDREGTVALGTSVVAVAGGILAELLMEGRIRIENGKKGLVEVLRSKPTGDALLDECLQRIESARRRAGLQSWVGRIAQRRRLWHCVAQGLCRRGILRADEDRVLLLFRRRIYPEVDPVPERRIVERLRDAIFSDGREVDPRTTLLVSLAHGAGLLQIPFDKKELRARKERIRRIAQGELIGKATRGAVEVARSAAAVSSVLAAVVRASAARRH